MTTNEETPRRLSGGSQEVSTAGGKTTPTVPEVPPRRADARVVANVTDPVALWAEDQTTTLAERAGGDHWQVPEYGSPGWRALRPNDPRRYAAVLEAAELWRLRNEPDGPASELYVPVCLRLDAQAARIVYKLRHPHRPAWQLKATPEWPPVRIPGGGGRYLTHSEKRSAA